MSDERCSDLLCPICSFRCALYDGEIRKRVQEIMAKHKYKPPTEEQARANWDAMYPPRPTLKQRIWAKFLALAQWIHPGRN